MGAPGDYIALSPPRSFFDSGLYRHFKSENMIRLLSQTVESLPEEFGFRDGQKGVHNTRTMMLSDLETLLRELPPEATKKDYKEAIVEKNVLAKSTDSTRRYNAQRLSELYGLDPDIPLFRIFRSYWETGERGRPLLALLLALARDPILRLTSEPVLDMEVGERFDKTDLQEVLREHTGDRFSETSIKKISRMTGSSWTQGGVLEGRQKKTRQRPDCAPVSTAYALVLGHLCGVRGELLFDTFWTRVLGASAHDLHDHAQIASRRSLLTYRNAGGILEVDIEPALTTKEQELLREQN